jgi:hypothetical protein
LGRGRGVHDIRGKERSIKGMAYQGEEQHLERHMSVKCFHDT